MKIAEWKDARHFQILFQTVFLSYGLLFLGWQAEWWLYLTYFTVSIITQVVFEWYKDKLNLLARIKSGFPSVLISSLGLSLLLKTNYIEIAALAAFISISSKFLIRINGKHIFNPSAIGIVLTILLTNKAWFSPGQWGSSVTLLFGICCLGCIVVTRVQKLDTSLSFLFMFGILLFIRQIIYLGWPLDFFIQSLSTGSLLLFSFFMITDPKTTPNHYLARILWSASVAVLAFYLAMFQFINGAPIWSLIALQPLVPVLDKWFKSKKFYWYHQLHSSISPLQNNTFLPVK